MFKTGKKKGVTEREEAKAYKIVKEYKLIDIFLFQTCTLLY